jgi:glycosyltransferase involved in cell wall biosynthesis
MSIADEIKASGLFDLDWYLATYRDVALSGISPIAHFVRIGMKIGRNPGPKFDTQHYLSQVSSDGLEGVAPILHFIRVGRAQGKTATGTGKSGPVAVASSRLAVAQQLFSPDEAAEWLRNILSTDLTGKPKKLFPTFDTVLEQEVLSAAATLYHTERSRYEAIKVSVVMPTYNRADRIGAAIESIQAQSHGNFEILVVDDGSSDNSKEVLANYAGDNRVRTFWNDHQGVSAARNTALEHATGTYVFYLDSDNAWTPDFLSVMVAAFEVSGRACLYGASKLQNAQKEVLGYRGEPFNWDQCLAGNYIDMNVFAHRIEQVRKYGSFDSKLQRMVDWDLILRYTREGGAGYCPVLGCIYFEDSEDAGRISTSRPYIFRKIVHEKNRLGLSSTAETLDKFSLRFALKIPAPHAVRQAWGDYHYAESFRAALEALGHEVRIDFLEDWDKHPPNTSDVVVVLRGLSVYTPKPTEFSILWNISHPDQISYEEYSLYDIICVASVSYADLLSKVLNRRVHALLQCTDSRSFGYREHNNHLGVPGVFIGNSRNEFREIVKWAFKAGADLNIYGQRWEQFVPAKMISKDNLPNDQLADVYAAGRFVLNDHWASMRDFGIISNRIFDVVGCGGRLVSDRIPSIAQTFEGVVEMVDSPDELGAALTRRLPQVAQAQRRAASELVHTHHSFDARARKVMELIKAKLVGSDADASVSSAIVSGPRRKRVGLLLQQGRRWPTSSAFIRLIAPLTSDYAASKLELVYLNDVLDPQLKDCDICIVQRIAVREDAAADLLLERLERLGVPLFVDTDDAFSFHDQHRGDDLVLQRLMGKAREVWFSTQSLVDAYDNVQVTKRVIRNNLDPRFWRNYRKPVRTSFETPKVRFLYMGTATHDEDFLSVLPAFERLGQEMPDRFELTLIGAVRNPPRHSWLKRRMPPEAEGSYPRFVRWLVESGQFDVGIAPLTDSAFNGAKSDIKILDYAALGLVPMVSQRRPYEEAIKAGLAIGCKQDPADWFEKASGIIRDPQAYEEMRRGGLAHVWHERNALDAGEELADLLVS